MFSIGPGRRRLGSALVLGAVPLVSSSAVAAVRFDEVSLGGVISFGMSSAESISNSLPPSASHRAQLFFNNKLRSSTVSIGPTDDSSSQFELSRMACGPHIANG